MKRHHGSSFFNHRSSFVEPRSEWEERGDPAEDRPPMPFHRLEAVSVQFKQSLRNQDDEVQSGIRPGRKAAANPTTAGTIKASDRHAKPAWHPSGSAGQALYEPRGRKMS